MLHNRAIGKVVVKFKICIGHGADKAVMRAKGGNFKSTTTNPNR